MSYSNENVKLDDFTSEAIYASSKNATASDGTLDAATFCASASPPRHMAGVARQGSGEQIVMVSRDKEQSSLRDLEEDKVRPPVSTFSARGDEVTYNVLHGRHSNDETLFLHDNLQEAEGVGNCKSHHDIIATGSDVLLRKQRPFSSDGDLVGPASTRTYDENFMPNDLESGKGVRRKGEGKGSKQQQSSKATGRRPNVLDHKESLTYVDRNDDSDGTRLSREEEIRLKEESFIRQTFWIRGNDVTKVEEPDRSRTIPSSGSSRDCSIDSPSCEHLSRESSRDSLHSSCSSPSRATSSSKPSRDSSTSPSKVSPVKIQISRDGQTRAARTPDGLYTDHSPKKAWGSPNKSFSSLSSGSPIKYNTCRMDQLKELSREQLEQLAESLAMRIEELCDADDRDDKDAPGWVWRQRYQETLSDMEEQAHIIQVMQQEKAVLMNSFHSMEYCLLSVQREMREEREKDNKSRYKLFTDMAANCKSGDAMLHRAIAMMNDARADKEQLFCELSQQKDKVMELTLLLQRLRAFTSSLQDNIRCLRYQHVQDLHTMKRSDEARPAPATCSMHTFNSEQDIVDYIEGDPLERSYEHDIAADIQHNLSLAMAHCKQALCSDLYHEQMCLQGPECPQFHIDAHL